MKPVYFKSQLGNGISRKIPVFSLLASLPLYADKKEPNNTF